MRHVNVLIEAQSAKRNEMTPREKQIRFRRNVKETAGWLLLAAIPYLMIIHWFIVGY